MCKLSVWYLLRDKECGENSVIVYRTLKLIGADTLEINKCEIPSIKMKTCTYLR